MGFADWAIDAITYYLDLVRRCTLIRVNAQIKIESVDGIHESAVAPANLTKLTPWDILNYEEQFLWVNHIGEEKGLRPVDAIPGPVFKLKMFPDNMFFTLSRYS